MKKLLLALVFLLSPVVAFAQTASQFYSVPTLTELAALTTRPATVFVFGSSSSTNLLGANYNWRAADATAADGFNIVAPSGAGAAGRWFRETGYGTPIASGVLATDASKVPSITNALGGAVSGIFGTPFFSIKNTNGNNNAFIVQQENNLSPGSTPAPAAITGYGKQTTTNNQTWGVFGRAELTTPGIFGAATNEFNTFNYAGAPVGTLPPASISAERWTNAVQSVAFGDYNSLIGVAVLRAATIDAQSFLYGMYVAPRAATTYGLIVDADATYGPSANGALIRSTNAVPNLYLQTMGTMVSANSVFAVLDKDGVVKSSLSQGGGATFVTYNGNTFTTGTGTLTLGAGSTLATSATNSITLTSTGATNVTLPTTGTLATLAGSEALTNKSYNGNTWTAGTGVLTLGAGKTFTASNTLTLTATDGSTLAIGTGGTLGSNAYTSTSYLPLAGGTLVGDLLFTDATYDIGKSGATRPRDGFFSRALVAATFNGNTFTAGTGTLAIGASKTFTASNTLTLTATDGSTLAIGAGGTLGSNAYTSTAYAPLASPTFTGTVTGPTFNATTAYNLSGVKFADQSATYNIIYSGSGSAAFTIGGSGDQSTYMDNTQTVIRALGGGTTYATFNTSGITVGATVRANTGFSANGTAGLSATKTVRNSAGSGTCDLVFSMGLLVSSTC